MSRTESNGGAQKKNSKEEKEELKKEETRKEETRMKNWKDDKRTQSINRPGC